MAGATARQFTLPFDITSAPAYAAPVPSAPAPPETALPAPPVSPRRRLHVAPPSPSATVSPAWTVDYVRHPKARRYLLRVRVDGSVRATIPRGGTKREAVQFVEAHREWIVRQLVVAERVRANRQPGMPAAERAEHRDRAKRVLPPRLLELAARHGLEVRRISIRNQKGRWGSCSRQAHICLNWRLVTIPDWVRDYVLIHELMHLRRMDHSPAFWKHVAAACPDYQRARAWLRAHGGIADD